MGPKPDITGEGVVSFPDPTRKMGMGNGKGLVVLIQQYAVG